MTQGRSSTVPRPCVVALSLCALACVARCGGDVERSRGATGPDGASEAGANRDANGSRPPESGIVGDAGDAGDPMEDGSSPVSEAGTGDASLYCPLITGSQPASLVPDDCRCPSEKPPERWGCYVVYVDVQDCVYGDYTCNCEYQGPHDYEFHCSTGVPQCPATRPFPYNMCWLEQRGMTCVYGQEACTCDPYAWECKTIDAGAASDAFGPG